MTNIDKLIQTFRHRFPNFKTFKDSGEEYWKEEDAYKRACCKHMHELYDGWVQGVADSLSGEEVKDRLEQLLTKNIPGMEFTQNLTNWRDNQYWFTLGFAGI